MAELVIFLGNSCSLRIMLAASVFHGGVEGRMGNRNVRRIFSVVNN